MNVRARFSTCAYMMMFIERHCTIELYIICVVYELFYRKILGNFSL